MKNQALFSLKVKNKNVVCLNFCLALGLMATINKFWFCKILNL